MAKTKKTNKRGSGKAANRKPVAARKAGKAKVTAAVMKVQKASSFPQDRNQLRREYAQKMKGTDPATRQQLRRELVAALDGSRKAWAKNRGEVEEAQ